MFLPSVPYRDATFGVQISDPFSCLLSQRIVFIQGPIDETSANVVCAQLLYLEAQDPHADVTLYISSPGGSTSAGLAILDVMRHIKPDVAACVLGSACSMASVLLACAAKGKRYALPHSEVMIHQPLAGFQGQVTELEIMLDRAAKCKQLMAELLAEATGQSIDKIIMDCERDHFMSAEEALAYGMIDHILDREE